MQAYHTDKVRLLVSSVLSQTIEDARQGCHDAWKWASSDKAIEWAGVLEMDSTWLTACQAIQEPSPDSSLLPHKRKQPVKRVKPAAKLPDTPLVSALNDLADGKSTKAPSPSPLTPPNPITKRKATGESATEESTPNPPKKKPLEGYIRLRVRDAKGAPITLFPKPKRRRKRRKQPKAKRLANGLTERQAANLARLQAQSGDTEVTG